jgi:S-adenosylmethionine decarboxylase
MVTQEPPLLYAVDLAECEALATLAPEEIVAVFRSALEGAGAHVVQTVSHHFPGAGLTSVLILRESHAVLHTWPETGIANVDIFSCSPRLQSLRVVEELRRRLGAGKVTVQEVSRADGHAPASRRGHRRRARAPLEPSRRGGR